MTKCLEIKSCPTCPYYDQEWTDWVRRCNFKTKRGRAIDDSPIPKWCPLSDSPSEDKSCGVCKWIDACNLKGHFLNGNKKQWCSEFKENEKVNRNGI